MFRAGKGPKGRKRRKGQARLLAPIGRQSFTDPQRLTKVPRLQGRFEWCFDFPERIVDLTLRVRRFITRSVMPTRKKGDCMHARYCCLLLGSLLVGAAGCAMCSSCDDYSYTASGGIWERLDPCYGRVGSAFTPEVGTYTDELGYEASHETPAELLPAGEPTPADDPAPEPPDDKEANRTETSVLQNRATIAR
jgi:hypothetical protein